ncbi:MAG: hypothetical protein ACRCYV_01555, partial [Aeromonas sp.]
IIDGEIQIIPDNDAASDIDLSAASSLWKSIDGATGALVAKGHANAVKLASGGTAAYTLVQANGQPFEKMTNPSATPVGAEALKLLKLHGMYPVASAMDGDGFWHQATVTGEYLPFRGGSWHHGALCGVFAVYLDGARSHTNTHLGARPAFSL